MRSIYQNRLSSPDLTNQEKGSISIFQELLAQGPDTLPILRQSCLQILNLTEDRRSSANDIGAVIMRDQALMANIIKIANSPLYHTRTPVTTPTHAVTLIGFDVIRSIIVAAQLVEQVQAYGTKTECLKRFMVRSLVAATAALELGKATKYPEMGSLFTNAMLYTLGDLVLAFSHPEIAEQLEYDKNTGSEQPEKEEVKHVGRTLSELGATIAQKWNLPESLIQLLGKRIFLPHRSIESLQGKLEGLVFASNELARCLLFPPSPRRAMTFQTLMSTMSQAFALRPQTIMELTVKAFTKTYQFSDMVKIDQTFFLPPLDPTDTPAHTPIYQITRAIRQAVFPQSLEEGEQPDPLKQIPLRQTQPSTIDDAGHTSRPQPFLHQFTMTVMTMRDPNTLLRYAAEGLHSICGFERVILMFVTPSTGELDPRISFGINDTALLALFKCQSKGHHIFARTLQGYQSLKVDSFQPEVTAGHLPPEFIEKWGESPCLLGALFAPTKPIGLLIADRGNTGQSISDVDYTNFVLILSLINTAIARLAR